MSCLKETAVPIEFAFSIESSEDKTSPVTIQLKNESYGADEYEWTFSSSSNQRDPGARTIQKHDINNKIVPSMRYIKSKRIGNVSGFCPNNGDYAYTEGERGYLYIDGVLLEKDDAPLELSLRGKYMYVAPYTRPVRMVQ